jgi:carbon storage regulator
MLVLVRYVNDRIMIGDDIIVTITDVNRKSGRVKVGIEAPNNIRVDREEIRIAKNKNKNGVQNV